MVTESADDGIRYEPIHGFLSDGGVIMRAEYRGVMMHLVDGDDGDGNGPWLSIWFMYSTDPNKGHVQAMIQQLRVEWPGYTLHGSVPMHPAAKHIFDKCGIKYVSGDAAFDQSNAVYRSGGHMHSIDRETAIRRAEHHDNHTRRRHRRR